MQIVFASLGVQFGSRFSDDEFIAKASVLDLSSWPDNEDGWTLYGDSDIVVLAKFVDMPVSASVNAFREFKENQQRIQRYAYNFLVNHARTNILCFNS